MQAPVCAAVADSLRTADTARIAAGTYTLVVVSHEGRAKGTLELRRSAGDTAESPLYGWTDIDLPSIGLPIKADTGRFRVPAPSSQDPSYPGVVVLIQNWQQNHGRRQNALLIGTVSNRRDGVQPFDGGGIVLWVRRFDKDGGFEGSWGPWGVVPMGTGHFCAFRALNRSP